MTFLSSYHDKYTDQVLVWEKSETGKRVLTHHYCPYNFYVPDKDGTFKAITGEKLKKLEFQNKKDFDDACRSYPVKFESDLSPQEKVMMTYVGKKAPVLTTGFIDIEVDFHHKHHNNDEIVKIRKLNKYF